MSQEVILGRITQFNEDGTVVIQAAVPNIDRAILRQYKDVLVGFTDGRRISAKQRRAIYALLGEIADYVGDEVESQKEAMKLDFIVNHLQGVQRKMFSLADVDMTTAREFQSYLLDFIVQNNIPMRFLPQDVCDDIGRYVYSCLMAKRCCCCGRPAQLHHVTSVGSQGYRDKIDHRGLDCLPLCAEHHTESHNMGQKNFLSKWHLQPVKIDDKICKAYHLNTKARKSA
jgi:hypothetical protein